MKLLASFFEPSFTSPQALHINAVATEARKYEMKEPPPTYFTTISKGKNSILYSEENAYNQQWSNHLNKEPDLLHPALSFFLEVPFGREINCDNNIGIFSIIYKQGYNL